MNIGQRIQELREARGMPKAELARRARTTRNTLYRIEAGKTRPSAAMVEQLARGLDLDPGELFKSAPSPVTVVSAGKAEAPEAGYAAPEALEPFSSQVREWLQKNDAKFGLMSDEEFRSYVEDVEDLEEIDAEGRPQAILRLIEQLNQEDDAISKALNQEFGRGEGLFGWPKAEKGPGWTKSFFKQGREKDRLRREFRRQFDARRRVLYKYSELLFEAGVTRDYLVPANRADAERSRRLEQAFAESGAA